MTSIVWPGIRSHMLTGLRLSVGLAWIILVPAEMLGVDSGLGYLILVIGLCGCALDLAARWLFQPRRRTSGRISANAGNREATAQASYAPAATE